MIFDAQALFSNKQAITADAVSENVIDLGPTKTPPLSPAALTRKVGGGLDMPLLVQVTEDFATLTSLTVSIETDDNEAFSSAKTVASTQAVPAADLVAGFIFPLHVVPLAVAERYVRISYDVGGSNATAGAVTAGITTGVQTNG